MRLKSLALFLFIFFGAFLVNVKAVSYGYSYIEAYHPAPGAETRIYGESGTVLDYATWYYYDPGIRAFLWEDSYLVASTGIIMDYNNPSVGVWIDRSANYGRTYTLHGDHYLGAYYYYYSGGQYYFLDYWGYNFYSGTYPSPYSFLQGPSAYYNYQVYRVATTQVQISVLRPLHLDSIDRTGAVPGTSFLTTIRGTGFFGQGTGQGATQTVQVSGGGVTATVQQTQPNTIEVLDVQIEIAENAQVGDRNLTLTVNGQTSNSINFRVGDRTPQITDITPPQGNTGDQVPVTLTGTGFGFNPLIQINGQGVSPTITSSTTTQITAIFSVAEATYLGTRDVKVVSRGITGGGFMQVPGSSDTSNAVPFNVLADPSATIADVPLIEKNGTQNVNVTVSNAPQGVKFTLKPVAGASGAAKFTENDSTEIVKPNGNHTLTIKGVTESSAINKMTIEATPPNNASNILAHKEFTVAVISGLEFQTINTGDILNDNPGPNGGQRVFPDKRDSAEQTDRSIVRVRATVSPSDPSITVYFASFDLDDPSTDAAPVDTNDSGGKFGNDNNGAVSSSKSGQLIAPDGNCSGASINSDISKIQCTVSGKGAITHYKVTMNPGDNFAIAASLIETYRSNISIDTSTGGNLKNSAGQIIPIAGEANPNNVQGIRSKMLTVWREIHLETDRMMNVTNNNHVGGEFTSNVTILPSRIVFVPITPDTAIDEGRFYRGRIEYGNPVTSLEVSGNTPTTVRIWNRTGAAIFITQGTRFTMYDDDDYNNNDASLDGDEGEQINTPAVIFDNIDAPLAEAYIVTERNWAQIRNYNQANVPFDLNIDTTNGAVVAGVVNNNRNSAADEKDDFWIAYFVTGYQGHTTEDYDGYICDAAGNCVTEAPLFAFSVKQNSTYCDCLRVPLIPNSAVCPTTTACTTVPTGGLGSVILQEVLQDHADFLLPRVITVNTTVAAHEIGHQFGLQGDNFNSVVLKIMDYPNYNTINGAEPKFHPEHINIMRKRVKSPGKP